MTSKDCDVTINFTGTMTSEAIRFMVEHTLQNRPVYNTKAIVITDGAAQDVENLKTSSDLAKVSGPYFLMA